MVVKLKLGDCLEVLRSAPDNYADSVVTDPPAGISFMGKEWDDDKGGRDAWVSWLTEVMTQCNRVLKPGGYALVWALPRTSHWTMSALENAGFEIRDVVTHLFGSGFPKSMDISKAIDKAAGASREVVGRKPGTFISKGQNFRDDGWVPDYDKLSAITAPATPEAQRWQGFGTALKPACEFWVLVRKPLGEKTVAANVLKHGTGGLNIDGCRIEAVGGLTSGGACKGNSALHMNKDAGIAEDRTRSEEHPQGRFPANLVLDEEAAAALDEQTGEAPSRFFYVAKASKRDKGEGNTHPTVKSTQLMRYLIRLVTPPGGTVLDPFMGSGSTGVAAKAEGFGFVGIEQSPEYFAIAESRLKDEDAA